MAWAPHKKGLREAFQVEILPQHPTKKPVQSSWHPAVSTPSQPPHSSTVAIITANLLPARRGQGVPTALSPREAGAAPSLSPQGASGKFALQAAAGAFQLDVGTQPGGCCNTMGIPKESFPILQSELDRRGPFPSTRERQGRQLKLPFSTVTGWG